MQHKLATWAQSDPNRRFDRLSGSLPIRAWLAEAARIVLASSGAIHRALTEWTSNGCRLDWQNIWPACERTC
jgi:hypothetical protein